jgi:hypothetical protein
MNSISSIKYVVSYCRPGGMDGFHIKDNEVNLKLRKIPLKTLFFLQLGEDSIA